MRASASTICGADRAETRRTSSRVSGSAIGASAGTAAGIAGSARLPGAACAIGAMNAHPARQSVTNGFI
jgi:hypothetical protein